MLCPDFPEKDEEADPLEDVYALKKDNLLDESILNQSAILGTDGKFKNNIDKQDLNISLPWVWHYKPLS